MINYIYWNICELNDWKKIVTEQYSNILKSNILNVTDKVFISFLGKDKNNIQFLLDLNNKFVLDEFSTNLKHYERLCLTSLYKNAINNKDSFNVFYFHTKGVSRPGNECVQNWRRKLEEKLMSNYLECLNFLKEYDVLGCYLANQGNDAKITAETHKYHFSGNFWWSKSDYIKRLPSLEHIDLNIRQNAWLLERWVLHPYPEVKFLEIYQDPKKRVHFYHQDP
jgi:hypothetical protein